MASATPPRDSGAGMGRASTPLGPGAGGRRVRVPTAHPEVGVDSSSGAAASADVDGTPDVAVSADGSPTPNLPANADSDRTPASADGDAIGDDSGSVPTGAAGSDDAAPSVSADSGSRTRVDSPSVGQAARPPAPAVVVHRPSPRGRPVPSTPDRDYTRVTPAVASALSSPTRAAPLPPPAEPKQRRQLVPILLAGLVAVALGAVVVMALIYALSEDDEPSAQTVPTPTSSAGQAPTPQTSAPSTTGPTGGASVAPVGSGDRVPGLVAAASVAAGDSLEVTESVTWPDGGPIEIRLELPDFSAVSGLPAGLAPTIRDLQVSVDGNPVEPIPGIVAGTWVVRPLDVGVPQEMELRYLVDGALLRSTPSQPGRALAVVGPLSAATLGELPVQIRLAGSGVLNVACAGAPDATSALCASQDGDTWTATPPQGSPAVVVAQLDLSPPA